MQRYLYRGVNSELHEANSGRLIPKSLGAPFRQGVYWDTNFYWDDGCTFGESSRNAVIQHERDSSKNPTSGMSTTPLMENAKRYATHNGKYRSGYVYKIDTELLEEYGVAKYVVVDYATWPAVPENQEVILVAKDFSILPSEIVVELIEVIV